MPLKDVSIAVTIAIVLSAILLGATMGLSYASAEKDNRCVQIYFDKNDQRRAAVYAGQIQKLLFKAADDLRQVVTPIEEYRSGDLNRCVASVYLGTEFDNQVPRAFLLDYLSSQQHVMWLGYNIWQLGDQLEKQMGLRFVGMTRLHLRNNHPTYFKEVLFKGKTLDKTGFEQAELVATDFKKFHAVAEVRHNGTREVIPYIVQAGKRFYMADVPFTYLQDVEKEGILGDVLSDIVSRAQLKPISSVPIYKEVGL